MPRFDPERRDFFRMLLFGMGILFLKFSGIEQLAEASSPVAKDEIGLVYNTATGNILRTINPGPGEGSHLDWVQKNLPAGTSLLRINKSAIGADAYNCPNINALRTFI